MKKNTLLSKRTEMARAFWATRKGFWDKYLEAKKENGEECPDPEPYLFVDALLIAALEAGWLTYDRATDSMTWVKEVPKLEGFTS
jgi:hypothetical protein